MVPILDRQSILDIKKMLTENILRNVRMLMNYVDCNSLIAGTSTTNLCVFRMCVAVKPSPSCNTHRVGRDVFNRHMLGSKFLTMLQILSSHGERLPYVSVY